jgi:hypothetical protein
MQNLKLNWLIKDEDFDKYYERGLCDGLEIRDDKKVKKIIGYFEDEDEEEDFEIIAYISCDGDVEDIDLLDEFFCEENSKKYNELIENGVIEEWDEY